jgi:AcrR family transcriptional regulator
VTELPNDRRADSARGQILRAAGYHFAHRPYSVVSLDDILADAEVTKGAMYFHFRSKFALASTLIDEASRLGREAAAEVTANKLSGLETLIDVTFLVAIRDITEDISRAALHLLESIGRAEGLQAKVLGEWTSGFADILRRGVAEGDIAQGKDPDDVARLLVSTYIGIRQTSNPDDPEQFLGDLGKAWALMLPGFANPDRIGYLTQFVKRRTTIAINRTTSRPDSA